MKLAVVGSRNISHLDMGVYLPRGVDEIVSGGAKGIDRLAALYAKEQGIVLTEFFPDYVRYGKAAPLKRNEKIVMYADEAIAFWDGRSRGTAHVIGLFQRARKRVTVILVE